MLLTVSWIDFAQNPCLTHSMCHRLRFFLIIVMYNFLQDLKMRLSKLRDRHAVKSHTLNGFINSLRKIFTITNFPPILIFHGIIDFSNGFFGKRCFHCIGLTCRFRSHCSIFALDFMRTQQTHWSGPMKQFLLLLTAMFYASRSTLCFSSLLVP